MNAQELHALKEWISNWSEKRVQGTYIDELFMIEGMPLSWFYRPILYSNLLPRSFPSVEELLEGKSASPLIVSSFSFLYRQYLQWSEGVKQLLRKNVRGKKLPQFSPEEKILFLTFTNHLGNQGKIFRLQPIIEEVARQKKQAPFSLVIDPFSRVSFSRLRSCQHMLYEYVDTALKEKANRLAQNMAYRWKKISEEEKREVLRYKGKNLLPLLEPSLDFLYSSRFVYYTALFTLTFQKIISLQNIRAIVVSSQNNLFEKCLLAAAKKSSIPVFVVQHGIGLGTLPTIDAPENVRFLVFGEKYKQELTARGVPSLRIEVTGPLIFEGIENFIKPPVYQNKNKDSYPNKNFKKSKIVVATSPFIEDRFLDQETYFARLRQVLQELKKVSSNIHLKLHPRERHVKKYQKMMRQLELQEGLCAETDREKHFSLLAESDVVVTFGSTVALEAMILGKPTLTVDFFDENNPTNKLVVQSGATPVFRYDQQFSEMVKKAIVKNTYCQEAQRFVKHLCFRVDGKAAERCVRYIVADKKNL